MDRVKKIWWICPKGHEWEATPNSRTNGGNNCPYCSNQKICEDNCLATINPDLAKEWHPIKNKNISPHDISPHSGKKAWWQCKNGHEWRAAPYERDYGGCPYCSGQKVCEDNCLATINPDLAKEWDVARNFPITPEDVGAYSPIKYWWKCENGHTWQASVNNRNRHGRGCQKCGKYVMPDGAYCASLIEAFYYHDYKSQGIVFEHDKSYPNSRYRYDFYILSQNKYVEVTSFTKKSRHGAEYYAKIEKKKQMVSDIGATFEFICRNLSINEMKFIKALCSRT